MMQKRPGTKGAIAENVDSTKAMLILSPCRKRSPFGPQNLTLSNVKRRNFGAR